MSADLPPQLGRYRLLRPLGEGGMGQVFVAEHVGLRRLVALKILHQGRAAPPALVARFQREIAALATLRHPHVVQARDCGWHDGVLFLVLELLDGLSLQRVLACRGPLPVAAACELCRQAADGLAYLQERDLVHRDIKPGNLQLTRAGVVKLLDLGVAGLRGELAALFEPTRSHVVVGTGDYMAPEQAERARTVDNRADVYSLGCTLYRLLTNRVPYPEADNLVRKLFAHQQTPFPPVDRADVPPELTALLARLVAKKPEDRPWPAEAARALAAFAAGADVARLLPDDAAPAGPDEPTGTHDAPAVSRRGTTSIPVATDATTAEPRPGLAEADTVPERPPHDRRRLLALAALGLGGVGVVAWLRQRPRGVPADPPDLDAHPAEVPVALLKLLPAAPTGADPALDLTAPGVVLLGTTAARQYQVRLAVFSEQPLSFRLVLGYDRASGAHIFVEVTAEPSVVVGRDAGGPQVFWAGHDLAGTAGEHVLQVEVHADPTRRAVLRFVRFDGPLVALDARLRTPRAAVPPGAIGIARTGGRLRVRDARFTRLG